MQQTIYPISSIVAYIKSTLDQNPYLNGILIQGEVSNLKKHRSGHWYFTLKDAQARLSCVMFAAYAARCQANVHDGSKVIVKGSVSMYEPQGSVQCYVSAIREDGLGDLYLRYEELKKKLFAQGLFADAHKQAIPAYASDIGIISAKEGAALQDVLTTIQKRWPLANLTLYPAYVQGAQASSSLIQALQKADAMHHDCLLLVRGGGSIEDLWGFNSEALVHCIYALQTPIISGVGHESDTTLVDYVCDVRAPTPTGAAQRATSDYQEVLAQLAKSRQLLAERMARRLQHAHSALSQRARSRYLLDPLYYIKDRQMRVAMAQAQLERIGEAFLEKRRQNVFQRDRLYAACRRQLLQQQQRMTHKHKQLTNTLQHYAKTKREAFGKRVTLLDAYSPLAILQRGYTLVEQEGQLVKSARPLTAQSEVTIRFHDGRWRAVLKEKEEHHGEESDVSAVDGTAG